MGDSLLNAILEWMQNNRIRLASYDRIVSSVPGASTPNEVAAVVGNYPGIFRTANIKGGIPGLALVDGYKFPEVTPGPSLTVGDLNAPVNAPVSPTAYASPAGYAEPAQIPVEHCSAVGYAAPATEYPGPAPTSAPATSLTPHEAAVKLLNLAATSDVSGSALNYANAAVAAATAVQLLNDQ